jgi:hypothetical protein
MNLWGMHSNYIQTIVIYKVLTFHPEKASPKENLSQEVGENLVQGCIKAAGRTI